jgi:hypothetical protein
MDCLGIKRPKLGVSMAPASPCLGPPSPKPSFRTNVLPTPYLLSINFIPELPPDHHQALLSHPPCLFQRVCDQRPNRDLYCEGSSLSTATASVSKPNLTFRIPSYQRSRYSHVRRDRAFLCTTTRLDSVFSPVGKLAFYGSAFWQGCIMHGRHIYFRVPAVGLTISLLVLEKSGQTLIG